MKNHVVITYVRDNSEGKLLTSRSIIECISSREASDIAQRLETHSKDHNRITCVALRIYDVNGRPVYVNPDDTLDQLAKALPPPSEMEDREEWKEIKKSLAKIDAQIKVID